MALKTASSRVNLKNGNKNLPKSAKNLASAVCTTLKGLGLYCSTRKAEPKLPEDKHNIG